ncbi:kinase-like domain-containing protein [Panaeolus papilionaceus]|nr:kinase-like domain-containing protein [Panaeolus papilionaceus]
MLAAATSFFARTNINQSYNIGSSTSAFGSRPATPGAGSSLTAPAAATPTFHVGLWKVQSAWHKVTNKRVSVWTFDKRGPDLDRLSPPAKERVMEVMKLEASSLGRLRHPSILEMVEPLEETRFEMVFATEPVLSSLSIAIPDSGRTSAVELDEIEIQKGILQLCKGLSFLHTSAKLIHSNICPETIIINGAGDWKISGLGLTIAIQGAHGGPAKWEFPTFDGRVPPSVQRSFDYMAPEYALDEQLVTESDIYALGCLLYAVHSKGNPPFKNHGSLGSLRDNSTKPLPGLERMDSDLQALLRSLITRHYGSRPTPETLHSHPFFSSLPISTLNFLDRSNFTAKTREEKVSFMKGLTGVLDRFSDGLRTRKILPSLLEEMKDLQLLPYILPNVFAIAQSLTPSQFASQVLPSLKPLFAIKEPPQNMLTLLDNLTMLQDKTEKNVFREHVLPLVYNALDSEHAIVQERALKMVPGLCDSIDYAEVQGVLFPRVALVFTKTRLLSVKVATLVTFLAMVSTLDQSSLTQKLVPLLSKIRTKEPAVTMATLDVQEAMGFKVDREAVATLVLPQLWAMSMGPLLSVGQFQRFMQVIKKLGERVEREHDQFLRDSQRLEDRSGTAPTGTTGVNGAAAVDFESLVGRANGAPVTGPTTATVKADTVIDNSAGWEDDVWGSIFNESTPKPTSPVFNAPAPSINQGAFVSTPSVSQQSSRPSFQSRPSALQTTSSPSSLASHHIAKRSIDTSGPSIVAAHISLSSSTTHKSAVIQNTPKPIQPPPPPNYNINFSSFAQPATSHVITPMSNTMTPMSTSMTMPIQSAPLSFTSALTPAPKAPTMGGMSGLLVPSKPVQNTSNARALSKDDWGDFDPLS